MIDGDVGVSNFTQRPTDDGKSAVAASKSSRHVALTGQHASIITLPSYTGAKWTSLA